MVFIIKIRLHIGKRTSYWKRTNPPCCRLLWPAAPPSPPQLIQRIIPLSYSFFSMYNRQMFAFFTDKHVKRGRLGRGGPPKSYDRKKERYSSRLLFPKSVAAYICILTAMIKSKKISQQWPMKWLTLQNWHCFNLNSDKYHNQKGSLTLKCINWLRYFYYSLP